MIITLIRISFTAQPINWLVNHAENLAVKK